MTTLQKLNDSFDELDKARRNDTSDIQSMRDIMKASNVLGDCAFDVMLDRIESAPPYSTPLREVKKL
jgi:hypothetical protein